MVCKAAAIRNYQASRCRKSTSRKVDDPEAQGQETPLSLFPQAVSTQKSRLDGGVVLDMEDSVLNAL